MVPTTTAGLVGKVGAGQPSGASAAVPGGDCFKNSVRCVGGNWEITVINLWIIMEATPKCNAADTLPDVYEIYKAPIFRCGEARICYY